MREKLEHLFGDILMGSLKPAAEYVKNWKKRSKEQEEREALQKFLDGFKGKK